MEIQKKTLFQNLGEERGGLPPDCQKEQGTNNSKPQVSLGQNERHLMLPLNAKANHTS